MVLIAQVATRGVTWPELGVVAVTVAVGLWLLVRGARGAPSLSAPLCPRCSHDLRRLDGVFATCPECGRTLGAGARVRFGRARRRPLLALVGAAVLVVGPPVGLRVLGLVLTTADAVAAGLKAGRGETLDDSEIGSVSDGILLELLPSRRSRKAWWEEVERRRASGDLSASEVRAAALDVLDVVEAEFGSAFGTGGAERIHWHDLDILDDTIMRRFAVARLHVDVTLPARAHRGEMLPIDVSVGRDAIFVRVVGARGPDGTALTIDVPQVRRERNRGRLRSVPGGGSVPGHGTLVADLEPGVHRIEVDFDVAIPDERSAPPPAPPNEWDTRLAVTRHAMTVLLDVVPDDDPVVVHETNEALRGVIRKILEPTRLSFANVDGGTQVHVEMSHGRRAAAPRGTRLPMIAMRARLRVADGTAHDLGPVGQATRGTVRALADRIIAAQLEHLEKVDIIFEPAPDLVRHDAETADGPIWGEPVVFEGIVASDR